MLCRISKENFVIFDVFSPYKFLRHWKGFSDVTVSYFEIAAAATFQIFIAQVFLIRRRKNKNKTSQKNAWKLHTTRRPRTGRSNSLRVRLEGISPKRLYTPVRLGSVRLSSEVATPGSISPMLYEQLLRLQIPKAQKSCLTWLSFLRFWDLRAQKRLVERWWNWPQSGKNLISVGKLRLGLCYPYGYLSKYTLFFVATN